MTVLLNKNIAQQNTEQLRLSIQIDLSGFSFIIKDIKSGEILYHARESLPANIHRVEDIEEYLDKFVKNEPLFIKRYNSVSVYFDTEKYTLIPAPLYRTGSDKDLLGQLYNLGEMDEIHTLDLPDFDTVMIYAIPNSITAPIHKICDNINFYPISLPLLQNNNRTVGVSNNRISVYYKKEAIHIVATSGRQLKLAGAYPAKDFITGTYFIFNSAKEVMFNPEHTSVYLYGHNITKDIQLLNRYFKKIKRCALSEVL